jgi:hypothetical protein
MCKNCRFSKWVGVDGWGNYCSNPKRKNVVFCEDVKKCDLKIVKN